MAKALAADAKYISDKIAQAQPLQLQSIIKDDATIQLHFKETKPIQVRPCRQTSILHFSFRLLHFIGPPGSIL